MNVPHSLFRADHQGHLWFYEGPYLSAQSATIRRHQFGEFKKQLMVLDDDSQSYDRPCLFLTRDELHLVGMHYISIPPYELGSWGWDTPFRGCDSYAKGAAQILEDDPLSWDRGNGAVALAFFRSSYTKEGVDRAYRDLKRMWEKLGQRFLSLSAYEDPQFVGEVFLGASRCNSAPEQPRE
jgi:hypothetical protein